MTELPLIVQECRVPGLYQGARDAFENGTMKEQCDAVRAIIMYNRSNDPNKILPLQPEYGKRVYELPLVAQECTEKTLKSRAEKAFNGGTIAQQCDSIRAIIRYNKETETREKRAQLQAQIKDWEQFLTDSFQYLD